MKLPKLQLKSFSGNFVEWQSFWDTFESTVNKNTDISRILNWMILEDLCDRPQQNLQLLGCLSLKIITKLPLIFLEMDLVNHSCLFLTT